MLKLAILSDLHIRPTGVLSHGLDPSARLARGIDWLNQKHGDADLCILAGDLTDLGDAESYARLKQALQSVRMPVAMTIGNHDDRDTFVQVFGTEHQNDTGYIDKAIDLKGYRILLLDSAVTGEPGGRLEPEQMHWLNGQLDGAADRPVIVVLHHHANPLRTRVDRILLANGMAFARELSRHKDVRQVIAGHVHYTSTAIWHGVPFTTLAGGHYSAAPTLDPDHSIARLDGPAQMAIVLGDADGTTVHFDDYITANAVLGG